MAAKVHAQLEAEQIIREAEMLINEPKERFTFDKEEHVYRLDGKPMHGITSVLKVINKPALIQWSANEAVSYIENNFPTVEQIMNGFKLSDLFKEAKVAHRKKKEDAGLAGTDVHAEIEAYINYCMEQSGFALPLKASIKEEVAPQTLQFVNWAVSKNVKFLASEIRLYSEKLWVAGTADFICEIDGKLYVGDVKTSSAVYPEYFIQTSAYAHMAREMGLYDKFHGVIIVNVPKRGGLVVKENYDLKGNFEAFKAALTLHKFQEAQITKK